MSINIFDAKGVGPLIVISALAGITGGFFLNGLMAPPELPPVQLSIDQTDRVREYPLASPLFAPTEGSGDLALAYIEGFAAQHPTYTRAINISKGMLEALWEEATTRTDNMSSISGWRVYYGNPPTSPHDYKAIIVPINSAYDVVARSDDRYIIRDIHAKYSNPCPNMCDGEISDRPPIESQ